MLFLSVCFIFLFWFWGGFPQKRRLWQRFPLPSPPSPKSRYVPGEGNGRDRSPLANSLTQLRPPPNWGGKGQKRAKLGEKPPEPGPLGGCFPSQRGRGWVLPRSEPCLDRESFFVGGFELVLGRNERDLGFGGFSSGFRVFFLGGVGVIFPPTGGEAAAAGRALALRHLPGRRAPASSSKRAEKKWFWVTSPPKNNGEGEGASLTRSSLTGSSLTECGGGCKVLGCARPHVPLGGGVEGC